MNYYASRQRLSDKRYDFTCKNDNRVWPVGYCAGPRVYTAADFNFMSEEAAAREAEKLNAKYGPLRERFHTDGHATEAEAQACYRSYLLDTRLEFANPALPEVSTQVGCAHCGAWATGGATLDQSSWPLCGEHQTRAIVELLFPSVGTIVSSY